MKVLALEIMNNYSTKKLIIMRHGETDFNMYDVYQGQLINIGLNEYGKSTVRSKLLRIKEFKPKVIITSKLRRAVETAEIINESLKVEIIYTDLLNEINMGTLEGLSKIKIRTVYPNIEEQLKKRNFCFDEFDGESYISICQRIEKLNLVISNLNKDSILLVSHKGFILHFMEYNGISTMDRNLKNSDFTVITFEDEAK